MTCQYIWALNCEHMLCCRHRAWERQSRFVIIWVLFILLSLFYTIPVGAVQALIEVQRLNSIPGFKELNSITFINALIQAILPGALLAELGTGLQKLAKWAESECICAIWASLCKDPRHLAIRSKLASHAFTHSPDLLLTMGCWQNPTQVPRAGRTVFLPSRLGIGHSFHNPRICLYSLTTSQFGGLSLFPCVLSTLAF